MEEVNKRTLAVIPCFNEEATIGSVVLKAKRYVDEVVVIDDGSTDKTAKIAEYAGATVLRHDKNRGYGAALKSGFEYARENDFDVMTILDGDGQHDADQIQTVMMPVSEGKADICVGSRFLDSTGNMVPMYRHFGIAVLTKFTNAGSDKENRVTDGQSGFRAYSRKAIANIDLKDPQMGASAEILLQGRRMHLNCEEVPITCSYEGDCSTERPVGHGLGVLISILKYLEVEHSLLFFGVPGFILFIAGLFSGLNVYLTYTTHEYLPFGPSLLTIALLILGLLLGMTGLILHAVINANQRR
jgi:glycosyltransferase involved in cell wall biosynthesis